MKNKEEIINELLNKSLNYLENTENFIAKEAPVYVNELLHFKFMQHMVEGVTDTITGTLLIGSFMSAMCALMSLEFRSKYALPLAIAGGLFVGFLGGTSISSNDFMEAYKAKTAPRVYLIDHIKGK